MKGLRKSNGSLLMKVLVALTLVCLMLTAVGCSGQQASDVSTSATTQAS